MWFRNNSSKEDIDIERNLDYNQITVDIRNFKPLTPIQLELIKTLPIFYQFEIIKLFNECHCCIDEILEK